MAEFKRGDLVHLKSGSPDLVVSKVDGVSLHVVMYSDAHGFISISAPADCFQHQHPKETANVEH